MNAPHHALGKDEIHIWRVLLAASRDSEKAFKTTLSKQEIQRSERYADSELRRQFTLSHGVLRLLLSRYVGVSPLEIVFGQESGGKPILKNDGVSLKFNMSHSDDLAVYAFANDIDLGIDIERLRFMPDLTGLAKLCFSGQERADLQSLMGEDRTRAFFRCWTRKEAYSKAVGQGLALPLNSFEVGLRPGEPPRLQLGTSGDLCRSWRICDIIQPHYAGAAAFQGAGHTIHEQPQTVAEELARTANVGQRIVTQL